MIDANYTLKDDTFTENRYLHDLYQALINLFT